MPPRVSEQHGKGWGVLHTWLISCKGKWLGMEQHLMSTPATHHLMQAVDGMVSRSVPHRVIGCLLLNTNKQPGLDESCKSGNINSASGCCRPRLTTSSWDFKISWNYNWTPDDQFLAPQGHQQWSLRAFSPTAIPIVTEPLVAPNFYYWCFLPPPPSPLTTLASVVSWHRKDESEYRQFLGGRGWDTQCIFKSFFGGGSPKFGSSPKLAEKSV